MRSKFFLVISMRGITVKDLNKLLSSIKYLLSDEYYENDNCLLYHTCCTYTEKSSIKELRTSNTYPFIYVTINEKKSEIIISKDTENSLPLFGLFCDDFIMFSTVKSLLECAKSIIENIRDDNIELLSCDNRRFICNYIKKSVAFKKNYIDIGVTNLARKLKQEQENLLKLKCSKIHFHVTDSIYSISMPASANEGSSR